MAPTVSLRSVLANAGRLFSQTPLFRDLLNDLPNSVPSLYETDGASPSYNDNDNDNDDTGYDWTPISHDVTPYEPLGIAPSCPLDGPVSCSKSVEADSCCFLSPGGRLLLTQFWDDKAHVDGGEEDWTLHGLWPDNCDGSYEQYCGMTPKFENISAVLEQFDQGELLTSMNRYWIADYGTNDHLWAHEYNKHASCINTLAPSCYGEGYKPGMEVVDYFIRAFELFRKLDTFSALKRVGIEPDSSKTYALSDIQTALEEYSGSRVILKCSRHGVLHEAWYVFFVLGNLQSGELVPARDSFKGDHGNCPSHVRYLPKRK